MRSSATAPPVFPCVRLRSHHFDFRFPSSATPKIRGDVLRVTALPRTEASLSPPIPPSDFRPPCRCQWTLTLDASRAGRLYRPICVLCSLLPSIALSVHRRLFLSVPPPLSFSSSYQALDISHLPSRSLLGSGSFPLPISPSHLSVHMALLVSLYRLRARYHLSPIDCSHSRPGSACSSFQPSALLCRSSSSPGTGRPAPLRARPLRSPAGQPPACPPESWPWP